MKYLAIFVCVIFSLFSFVSLYGNETATDTVVALVNGEAIHMSELNGRAELPQIVQTLERSYPVFVQTLINTQEGFAFLRKYKNAVLSNIIDEHLLLQGAEKMGITVSASEINVTIENAIQGVITQNHITKEEFLKYLQSKGYKGLSQFKERLKPVILEQLRVQKLKAKVTANATVTEEEAKDYYTKNATEFTEPEKVRVSYIMLKDEKSAKDVADKIKSGKISFSDAVQKYSTDEYSKKTNGDLGWVSRKMLGEEFDNIAFNTRVGEVIGPLKTKYGWHVMKVTGHVQQEVKAFSKVRGDIEKKLLMNKKSKMWEDWYSNWKKNSKIKRFL